MKKKKFLKKHHVHKSVVKKHRKYRKIRRQKVRQYHKKQIRKQKRHYKKRTPKTVESPVVVVVNPPSHAHPPAEAVLVKRGRKPRGSSPDKMYFTQDTENSIILYNATEDTQIREDLYNTKIKHPFEKLVENIFNTFKFSYFETGPLDVQKETVAHLVSNMH